MPTDHEKFYSANGKRLILVADDEFINREILKSTLESDYEVLTAEDGIKALDLIRGHSSTLSLVLLDLMMPGMPGLDLLREMKSDQALKHIPVIVLTADQSSEIESLNAGAIDFIPKPYPQAGVILARIRRTIELSEDRQIIQVTERDNVTGLYNKEYFYRYAEQYDQYHPDFGMDAAVVDISHFHIINERFGKSYGNRILRLIGENLRDAVTSSGGIVCRREADTFLIYCPHREDYKDILEKAEMSVFDDAGFSKRVHLRAGVYSNADKTIDCERRFDRAKLAADTIRGSYTQTIAIYDDALHESELYSEQLVEDFQTAIDEKQFTVFYQPKFDIRTTIPVLASAEALVRWKHPALGMISPGVFIPLFEKNGLIRDLDSYVWEKAAAQIKDWKDRLGVTVPVSVNVSRIDMYDPDIVETFQSLMRKYGLTPSEFLLEITESAYTEDSAQIISTVNRLRSVGFKIEMDDFGTGYSSLNMISSLPIDALKLDMKFIREAFRDGQNTRMIEVIIDIADYLGVPVIAEGVETEEQLTALKNMGCDIVQGYYFSKPLPPAEYEIFVEDKRSRSDDMNSQSDNRSEVSISVPNAYTAIAHALTGGFECVYYVDTETGHYVEFSSNGKYEDLQIERSGTDFFGDTRKNARRVVYPGDRERVTSSLEKNVLLTQLTGERRFSMTYRLMIDGKPEYYNLCAVKALTKEGCYIVIGVSNIDSQINSAESAGKNDEKSVTYFSIAQALAADYFSIYYIDITDDSYIEYNSGDKYKALNIEKTGKNFFEQCRLNILRLVHPDDRERVLSILTKENLLREMKDGSSFTFEFRIMYKDNPTYVSMKATRMEFPDNSHIVIGINNIDARVKREQELGLARERANRDALTGVKSKYAYIESENALNSEIEKGESGAFAVGVFDLNNLKAVNDTRGHQAGDKVIKDAAMIICRIFSHSPVFRIGGDEFAVIMRGNDYEKRESLALQLREANDKNRASEEIIIAFGMSEFDPASDKRVADVFGKADEAMYRDKSSLKSD